MFCAVLEPAVCSNRAGLVDSMLVLAAQSRLTVRARGSALQLKSRVNIFSVKPVSDSGYSVPELRR